MLHTLCVVNCIKNKHKHHKSVGEVGVLPDKEWYIQESNFPSFICFESWFIMWLMTITSFCCACITVYLAFGSLITYPVLWSSLVMYQVSDQSHTSTTLHYGSLQTLRVAISQLAFWFIGHSPFMNNLQNNSWRDGLRQLLSKFWMGYTSFSMKLSINLTIQCCNQRDHRYVYACFKFLGG